MMNRPSRRVARIALLVLALGWPGFAVAAPFTVGYTVTVTELDPLFASAFNAIGVFVGGTITGSYTLETTTPDDDPLNADLGIYSGGVIDASASIGGWGWTFDTASDEESVVQIWDGLGGTDLYLVNFPVFDSPVVGVPPLFIGLVLSDRQGGGLSSDAITVVPSDLSLFEDNFLVMNDGTSTSQLVVGTITSLFLVPEPSSVLLLGAGLAGLGWMKRRGSRA